MELIGVDSDVSRSFPAGLRHYQFAQSCEFLGWSRGQGLFYLDGYRVFHLEAPGGAPRLVHEFKNGKPPYVHLVGGTTYPELLYTEDENNDENYRIFRSKVEAGVGGSLTPYTHRCTSPVAGPLGGHFVFKANLEKPDRIDLFLGEQRNSVEFRKVFSNVSDGGRVLDWSADGEKLLVSRMYSRSETTLHLLRLFPLESRELNETATRSAYTLAQFVPGSSEVLWSSDESGEFQELFHFDLATGKKISLTPGLQADVTELEVTPDGQKAIFATLKNGISQLYCMDLGDRLLQEVTALPEGQVESLIISPHGNEVGFTMWQAGGPPDIYVYGLATGKLVQWTNCKTTRIGKGRISKPESFTYPVMDALSRFSLQVQAFLYQPNNQTGPHPVIINLHGGPALQALPRYNPWIQCIVNRLGVAVIAPNFRGSSGFGKTFMQLDDGFRRLDVIRDVGSLLDWISDQPGLDEQRIILMGESYGGFLALAAAIEYPDKIKGVISGFGVTDWPDFLDKTAPYRQDLRRAEYGDERDADTRAYLRRISPVSGVSAFEVPLLLFAGYNDPRVPVSNYKELIRRLNKEGCSFQAALGRGEGHGFSDPENQAMKINLMISFIEDHLLD